MASGNDWKLWVRYYWELRLVRVGDMTSYADTQSVSSGYWYPHIRRMSNQILVDFDIVIMRKLKSTMQLPLQIITVTANCAEDWERWSL